MPKLVIAKQAARGINTEADQLLNDTTNCPRRTTTAPIRKWTLAFAIGFALSRC
jgi:hypothetical protein